MSLFARRNSSRSGFARFSQALWPKIGWVRFGYYLFWRLMRISSSPHDVAAGAAVGIAVSFTPLLGMHFLLATLVAFVARGNVLAAIIGTFVGNPLTFPLFWGISYQAGAVLESYYELPRLSYFADSLVLRNSNAVFWGSLPTALLVFVVLYPVFYAAVASFQSRREKVRLARAKDRRSKIKNRK